MNTPLFSVITPSFNSEAFIDDAIQSVLRQDTPEIEHIVIDAESTDGTTEILEAYPHLQWISGPDDGQADAINKGFLRSRGELVGWLNADDYYLPGALLAIERAARKHPEADVIYGDCVFVDERGAIVRSKVEHGFDRAVLMYFGCYIPSTTTFFRRRIVDQGYLLDANYRVCMDFEFFARLAEAECRFQYVPQVIAAFRWHESNVSLRQQVRRRQERLQAQRRFGLASHSERTLDLLAYLYRGKRIAKKIVSGNITREWRLRRMMGQETLWLRQDSAVETCAKLASL